MDYFCLMNEGIQTLTPAHHHHSSSSSSVAIKVANLHMNQIHSLESVASVLGPQLEDLDVSSNLLRSVVVVNQNGFSHLTRLNVSSNLLHDLSGVTSAMPHLTTLLACYNKIRDVSGIAHHPRLATVSLLGNLLSDTSQIHILSTLRNLRNVQLARGDGTQANPVTSTRGYRALVKGLVPGLTSLDEVWFENKTRESEETDDDDDTESVANSAYSTATPHGMSEISLDDEFVRHLDRLKVVPLPHPPPPPVVVLSTASIQTKTSKPPRRRDAATNTKDIITPVHRLCATQLDVIEKLKQQLDDAERVTGDVASIEETCKLAKEEVSRNAAELLRLRDELTQVRFHRNTLQNDLCSMERALAQSNGNYQHTNAVCQQLQRELEAMRVTTSDKENEPVVVVVESTPPPPPSKEKELLSKLSTVVREQRDALVGSQAAVHMAQAESLAHAAESQRWQVLYRERSADMTCRDSTPHCSVKEHAESMRACGKLQGAMAAASVANETMQCELAQCQEELREAKETASRLCAEVESQRRALHNLTATLREKDTEIDDIVAEGRRWREHAEGKGAELRTAVESVAGFAALQEQAVRCKSRLEDMNKECIRLREVVGSVRAQLAEAVAQRRKDAEECKEREAAMSGQIVHWQKVSVGMEEKLSEQRASVLAVYGR